MKKDGKARAGGLTGPAPRVVTVNLTRKGRHLVTKVPEVARGLLLTGLEGLSSRDLEDISKGPAPPGPG